MATYSVKTVQALEDALDIARNGDVIKLAPGDYSGLYVRDFHINGAVTITSQDMSNPAVLTDFIIRDSSGLKLTGLELGADTVAVQHRFQVVGSSDIVMEDLTVYGPEAIASGDMTSLMIIRESSNISVTQSEFFHGSHAVDLLNTNHVVIEGNYFHDLRVDGIRGGGNSYLKISNNVFTDFYPQIKDHPDAIQLWTTNTTTTAHDIEISDNLILRGDGEPTQGIFIRDTFDDLPFKNLTITGNMVSGEHYNGIAISGAQNVYLADNVVSGFADQRSWIRIQNVDSLNARNNQASTYLTPDKEIAGLNGNISIPTIQPSDTSYIQSWLNDHPSALETLTDNGSSVEELIGEAVIEAGPLTNDNGEPIEESPTQELYVISGTAGNDRLSADPLRDSRVEGQVGNDVIWGSADGQHELAGGAGNDVYIPTTSQNKVIEEAGQGYDTVRASFDYTLPDNVEVLRVETAGLTGHGNALNNRLIGSAGADILYGGAGNDTAQGGDGKDILYGGDGDDRIRGGSGADKLFGDSGNDRLSGDDGNDIINGGAGNDLIDGGRGADIMTGGEGRDQFLFRPEDVLSGNLDRITDFQSGTDRLSLSLIDAKSYTRGDDAFNFIGTAEFHKRPGELRYDVVAGNSYVQIDTDGNGEADMTIVLEGVHSLSRDDFII